jgi:hypothetical protein
MLLVLALLANGVRWVDQRLFSQEGTELAGYQEVGNRR